MDKVHVLVSVPFFKEEHLAKLAAVDPRLVVTDITEEIRAEVNMTGSSAFPEDYPKKLKYTQAEATKRLDKLLADTNVIMGLRAPLHAPSRAPHLKWVQTLGVGINHMGGETGVLQSDVILSNAVGINTNAVAEYALFHMVMLAKRARRLFDNDALRKWDRVQTMELKGKTLGLIGLGHIGGKIARVARAFEMRVLAARKSAVRREKDASGADIVYPTSQLLQMLPECDFLILVVPLTKDTTGIIGEAELRAMKPTSYLVNMSRGEVVKEDVLYRALKEGWIAGAGLDVFNTEPLPPDNRFWDLPNVIVSPHNGGVNENEVNGLLELYLENMRRFLKGEKLINLIDKERGY